MDAVTYLDEQARIEANMRDRIHAIGWTGLNNAFGGKGDYVDLLPFPQLIKDASAKNETLSTNTITCIKRLIGMDKIPQTILSAIAQSSNAIGSYLEQKDGLL